MYPSAVSVISLIDSFPPFFVPALLANFGALALFVVAFIQLHFVASGCTNQTFIARVVALVMSHHLLIKDVPQVRTLYRVRLLQGR